MTLAERDNEIWRLYSEGWSIRKIAVALGHARSTVRRAIRSREMETA